MSEEEKKAIEYLKTRLYGNEGCKFIDVAQDDLKIFLNLVDNQKKDIESWKKYSNEQDNTIILKNNKICDLEFKVEKQQKELEKNTERINELINEVTIKQCELEKKDKKLASQEKEIKQLKEDISNMYDEKVVRNILEDECGMSKYEIDEILN